MGSRENCENSEEKDSKKDFSIQSNDGPITEDIFDDEINPVMSNDDELSSERGRRKAFDKKPSKAMESNVESVTTLIIKDLVDDLVSSWSIIK